MESLQNSWSLRENKWTSGEGCRAHWAPEFCGWLQTPSDPTPERELFLCVLAKALCLSVSLPQKWHCPNTGSCPVAQLYFWPELLSAWPVTPRAWILTFHRLTPRNHVSQGWGLGGQVFTLHRICPAVTAALMVTMWSTACFLPRHLCSSCSHLCLICAGGAPWKPLSSWCRDEWFYLLDLGRIQGSFTLRLTHQIPCSPKAAITKMPRPVEWTFGV